MVKQLNTLSISLPAKLLTQDAGGGREICKSRAEGSNL